MVPSSTKVEYCALENKYSTTHMDLMASLDIDVVQSSPMILWCQNQNAFQIAYNGVFHVWTKGIEIDCHFARQHALGKMVRFIFNFVF